MARTAPPAGLGERRRAIAEATAEALLPAGRVFPAAGRATVERLEALLTGMGPGAARGYGILLDTLEYGTLLRYGSRFSRLPRQRREGVLDRSLTGNLLQRLRLFVLGVALESAHFDDPEIYRHFGCVYDRSGSAEPARWMSQVSAAQEVAGEDLECDVVVVGTGAGGAVMAKELAEAGLAVLMLEEGDYHTRQEFSGRSSDGVARLYRPAGETLAIGNTVIPVPLGCTVGGSTTVNSGTCFRTPERVLTRWREEFGLGDFTPEHMAPYFEKVERELGVEEAKAEYLGGVARVIARGCDRLGWSHRPLRRNAPECDGQGVCVFGCPTDAKRSTNVSYVPMALERAAMLVTGCRAERVLVEDGRAVGIEARALAGGRTLRVRARAVVLACGALLTPVFLMRQRLLRHSPQLGRNLTIHPAIAATGLFDEEMRAFDAIPQGYCVDEFHDDGILMEGCTAPLGDGGTLFNLVGRELVEVMEAYDRVASFGAMVAEKRGAGRVRLLPGGRVLIQYRVTAAVRERLQRAMVSIGEIFFAAGASRVFPAMHGIKEFRSLDELRAFARRHVPARDFSLTAYHPLGTCRIGVGPADSVLDAEHRVHEVPGLYVVDGSSLPCSPAVNPQITIMALATRAAERLAARLL